MYFFTFVYYIMHVPCIRIMIRPTELVSFILSAVGWWNMLVLATRVSELQFVLTIVTVVKNYTFCRKVQPLSYTLKKMFFYLNSNDNNNQ